MNFPEKRMLFAAIYTNLIDWYTFWLTYLMTPIFVGLFLPSPEKDHSFVAFIFVFTICIPYIFRFLGGVVFGYIGDRYGRRIALISSSLFVIIPPILVGLLPTSQDGAYIGFSILILLRVLQAFPLGGELPGLITLVLESVPSRRRGFFGGIIYLTAHISGLLAVGLFLLFTNLMGEQAFYSYGWRILFFISGVISFSVFFLRLAIVESPLFLQLSHHEKPLNPITRLLTSHVNGLIKGMLIAAFPVACFYGIFVGMGQVYSDFLQTIGLNAHLITFALLGLCMLLLPISGYIADVIGPRKMYVGACFSLLVLLGAPLSFSPFDSLTSLLGFLFLLSLSLSGALSSVPALLFSLFPTPVRLSGIAISYDFINSILATCIPIITVFTLSYSSDLAAPFYLLYLVGLFSIVTLLYSKRNTHSDEAI